MLNKTVQTTAPKTITAHVGAKQINSVQAYRHGVVAVIEINFSDSSSTNIKIPSNDPGTVEIGGTNELGTGTRVSI
jgi:hypothetical protein